MEEEREWELKIVLNQYFKNPSLCRGTKEMSGWSFNKLVKSWIDCTTDRPFFFINGGIIPNPYATIHGEIGHSMTIWL